MEEATFTHKGCGGRLTINTAGMFVFSTPSISLNSEGISLGVMELRMKSEDACPTFLCAKCGQEVDMKDSTNFVECRCGVCLDYKPVSSVFYSRQISSICSSCKDYLNGEKSNPPERVQRVMQVLDLRSSGFRFYKMSDILKKKISFMERR